MGRGGRTANASCVVSTSNLLEVLTKCGRPLYHLPIRGGIMINNLGDTVDIIAKNRLMGAIMKESNEDIGEILEKIRVLRGDRRIHDVSSDSDVRREFVRRYAETIRELGWELYQNTNESKRRAFNTLDPMFDSCVIDEGFKGIVFGIVNNACNDNMSFNRTTDDDLNMISRIFHAVSIVRRFYG